MKLSRKTIDTSILLLAIAILLAAIPSAWMDAWETGRIYLFSPQFIEELPQRLTGPGRMRFIIQPVVAMVLGVIAGRKDAIAGHPPYLYAFIFGARSRKALLHSGLSQLRNLLALSVVLDAISQFLIYGLVHPGAALLVGPILVCLPYAASRALSNRVTQYRRSKKSE